MKTRIPKFKSLEEERRFWDTHSITEFMDEFKPVQIKFIKPRKKLVSVRLDSEQIEALKETASQRGLGYLSLIRVWIAQCLKKEHRYAHQY